MTIDEIINVVIAFLNGDLIEYKSINSPLLMLPSDNDDSWQIYNPNTRLLSFGNAYNGLEVWRIKPKPIVTKRVGLFQNINTGKRKPIIVSVDELTTDNLLVDYLDIVLIEWLTDEFSYTINASTDYTYQMHKYRNVIIDWLNNKPIQFKFNNINVWIDFPNFQHQYLLDTHLDSFLTLFDHPMIQLQTKFIL